MRILTPIIYTAVFGLAIYAAVSQSPLPEAAASSPADGAATQLAYAAPSTDKAAPVRIGKRETCRQSVAAKKLRRNDSRDQLQICVAQARLDCLQQAIDQKLRGAARRVYVKSCVAA